MKRFARMVLPPLALLAVLAGAFLPVASARFMDRLLARETSQLENSAVSLKLAEKMDLLPELDFFETLTLPAGEYSAVAVSEGQRLTAEQAGEEAVVLVDFFNSFGLPMGAGKPDQAVPMLLTDRADPQRSGIFWRCGWDDFPEDSVWVDDRTGIAVAFCLRFDFDPFPFSEMTEILALYCEKQFPAVLCADFTYHETDEGSGISQIFLFDAPPEFDGDAAAVINVFAYDHRLYFNFPGIPQTESISESGGRENEAYLK